MKRLLLLCAAALMSLTVSAAEVPYLLPVDGFLTDQAGLPLSGVRTITFALHTSATGDDLIWNETQSVAVVEGRFSALLGEYTPLSQQDIADAPELWLELTVDGEALSRTPFGSVPYAVESDMAHSLGGMTADQIQPLIDDICPAGSFFVGWDPIGNEPLCDTPTAATPYSAGTGLELDDHTFSVDQATIEGWATGACYNTTAELTIALAGIYAASGHDHAATYALISHHHSGVYSLVSHDHDLWYSQLGHNHDGVYAAAAHTHTGVYAAAAHNHDDSYAAKTHTHTEYLTGITAGDGLVASTSGQTVTLNGPKAAFGTSTTNVTIGVGYTNCAAHTGATATVTATGAGRVVVQATTTYNVMQQINEMLTLYYTIDLSTGSCSSDDENGATMQQTFTPITVASAGYYTITNLRSFPIVSTGTYTYKVNGFFTASDSLGGPINSAMTFMQSNISAVFYPN